MNLVRTVLKCASELRSNGVEGDFHISFDHDTFVRMVQELDFAGTRIYLGVGHLGLPTELKLATPTGWAVIRDRG